MSSGITPPQNHKKLYHSIQETPPPGGQEESVFPTMMSKLSQVQHRIAITFAGQGKVELETLSSWAELDQSVLQWIKWGEEAVREACAESAIRWSGMATEPFMLTAWLSEPESRPGEEVVYSSLYSQPLIFISQIALWQRLWGQGLQQAWDAENIVALTGHSQGLMPALLVAEGGAQGIDPARYKDYVRYMLWQGYWMARSFEMHPHATERGSCMASIAGLDRETLTQTLAFVNRKLPSSQGIALTLENTRTRFVVSGLPSSLALLRQALQQRHKQEQTRKRAGQFAGRPAAHVWEDLEVAAPYHSSYMEAGLTPFRAKLAEMDWHIAAKSLQCDVLSPHDQSLYNKSEDLLAQITQEQFVLSVRWQDTVTALKRDYDVAFVLDLGPSDGVARLSRSCLRGNPTHVVPTATAAGTTWLFDTPAHEWPLLPNYRHELPRPVKSNTDQRLASPIANRFTKHTGCSPFILPGMTPTTSDVGLVAAAANAGFVAELAGGGQTTARTFWLRMEELQEALEPGREVVFNSLYLDPYLWGLHIRQGLVQKARRAGFPLCGVTISAGIPEVEEAVALLDSFVADGLWLNAFKPGNDAQIKQVLQIAAAASHHTIHMHLEGGKAGGHHSWEDLDQLLLDNYHRIRAQKNIVLCVGGGIGDEARATALLTGTWAHAHKMFAMPVDAVFLGTLTMACLEASTSPQVKRALADAAGHQGWVFNGQVKGGMTSGKSQLNADIHYIENAAARCGRLLDEVAGDAEAVATRKAEIVEALNATAKPFFGELAEMSYMAQLKRMVALMAVGRGGRYEDGCWPDVTYRTRVADMIWRTEARLCAQEEGEFESVLTDLGALDNPKAVLAQVLAAYPHAATTTLHPADVVFFVRQVCARPGKPVNFVPVIDADVRRWYKSDSLWQAHDDRFEAEQVLIIPGPEALQGLREADEPIASMFQRFEQDLLQKLETLPATVQGQEPRLMDMEGVLLIRESLQDNAHTQQTTLQLQKDLPAEAWHLALAAECPELADVIHARRLVEGPHTWDNPWRLLCRPQAGATLVMLRDIKKETLTLHYHPAANAAEKLSLCWEGTTPHPKLTFALHIPGLHGQTDSHYILDLRLKSRTRGTALVVSPQNKRQALRAFYHHALFGRSLKAAVLFEEVHTTASLRADKVHGYTMTTGGRDNHGQVPLNMVFSLVWEPLFQVLSCDELVGGMMDLVHLDNTTIPGPGWPIQAEEELQIRAKLTHLEDQSKGRLLRVEALVHRGEAHCATVRSGFFIRGDYSRTPVQAQTQTQLNKTIQLSTSGTQAFAQAQDWLTWLETPTNTQSPLVLRATLSSQQTREGHRHDTAQGGIFEGERQIAQIALDQHSRDQQAHPVQSFCDVLEAQATPSRRDVQRRTLAQFRCQAPATMDTFAEVSGDANPIHRSHLFAQWAGLDQPIVHGMWTAAQLSHAIVAHVAQGKAEALTHFETQFIEPLAPEATVQIDITRTGVEHGALWVEATAQVQRGEDWVLVAKATASVAAPRTAYVFPGQGIQQKGMGMEAMARSRAARDVWEQADRHTRHKLGFSILQIVRENPQDVIVQGEVMRHPKGVLHLTQFTQVAMAVLAQAQVAELQERGIAQPDVIFCGHSVGEYNALAATGILPLTTVVEIVYQRGMVMHRLVPRDASGESGYRMVVIRPHYAGLDHKAAEALVADIREQTGAFIQIVNYNVDGRQYSVTGKIAALDALKQALSQRQRGKKAALIEIPGIDVPFHSSELHGGVANFREALRRGLPDKVDVPFLTGRYIPNLVPKPFCLDKAYVQEVFETTQSEVLREVLAQWADYTTQTNALARTLLIELLAWQFASPVRWIETQALLFAPTSRGGLGVERILEIGVGYQPTLANMARYTASLLDYHAQQVQIQNLEADAERVLMLDRDPEIAPEPAPEAASQAPSQDTAAAQTSAAQATEQNAAPVAAPASPAPQAGPVADQAFSHEEGLHALLALQAKVRPEQLRADESIDEVFDGVSSRRNQVLIDLGAEFGIGPIDGAHEKPLRALVEELAKRAPSYKAPGKYLRKAQDEAVRKAFGRASTGRKDLQAMLSTQYGLGEGLSHSWFTTLTLESREGNSGRGGSLGQATDYPDQRSAAAAYLDALVVHMAQQKGLQISKQSGGGAQGQAVDAAVVKELEDRILGPKGVLMQSAQQIAALCGHEPEPTKLDAQDEEEKAKLALYEAEYGDEHHQRIAPRFDAKKHVAFTSSWAFAHRDLSTLYFDALNQRLSNEEQTHFARRLAKFSDDPRCRDTAVWYSQLAATQGHDALAARFAEIAFPTASQGWSFVPSRPHCTMDTEGKWRYEECADDADDAVQRFIAALWDNQPAHVTVNAAEAWDQTFQDVLAQAHTQGLDFRGKTALLTGASPNSIALSCVRFLLQGGARVIVTTSTYNPTRLKFYRDVYQQDAAPGAELHVVPFNQASFQDTDALVDWIFNPITEQQGATIKERKPRFVPDLVLPFAAIKDLGTLDMLSDKIHAVTRAMLLSVERLIAKIAEYSIKRGIPHLPCHVVLPLSPNHGSFGGDGVYAETKAAMEVLLQKWHSEHHSWGRAITLCGARIGWVRGTGLMDDNNLVAAQLEQDTGARTFSNDEMGFLLTALCSQQAREAAHQTPLHADLTGNFGNINGLPQVVAKIRDTLTEQSATTQEKQALAAQYQEKLQGVTASSLTHQALPQWPQAWSDQHGQAETLAQATKQPSIDLAQSIVIVGTGEIGPCGSARTRFALELEGEISAAGVVELAWMTGLIRYDGQQKGGQWVDVESGEAVAEHELAARYRDAVQERVGLRFTDPSLAGFDPEALDVLTTVHLEKDFRFPVSSVEEATSFLKSSPESTRIDYDAESESWWVTRRAGSAVRVPRKVRLKRQVAGLIPSGFDFERFGITQEMIENVDRIALFNLVATVDAFFQAGLSPEELMHWLHPSRVANTQGAGIGGMQSLHRLYLDHILGEERQNDTLQETLINVMAAYVVQSYVGSYGPMSHPVAACATAAVSLEEGMDKILVGKADFAVTGGYDDIGREGVTGFADMSATADTDEMSAMGFEPWQMSRSNDVRRRGFVEAQGGGTLLLARGDVALRLGLPVQGVLAYAGSFGDGIHKSIPAPGLGALSSACGGQDSPLAKALAQYGCTADDIAIVSKHDTSTNANDPNENALHQEIQEALGRTAGNPLFVVSQKSLTGHPKGGAAAWQLIGLCQSLQSGQIPGNRNLESVDPAMQPYKHLCFSDRPLRPGQAHPLKAGLVTSLGFGHVSGLALVLHPSFFEMLVPEAQREDYRIRAAERREREGRAWAETWMGQRQAFVKRTDRRFDAPDGSRCQQREESAMLLDPQARLSTAQRYDSEGERK